MMESTSCTWVQLFRAGKWKDCSEEINVDLSELSKQTDIDEFCHSRKIVLENNLFVCDQMNKEWESETVENVSCEWAKSLRAVLELHRVMRCQHVCSELPLDILLCVTCNVMWWALMKVDPLQQHACQREVMSAALYALKAVGKSFGVWNVMNKSTGRMTSDFIEAVQISVSTMLKLTPIQCQLVFEILIMGSLMLLDDCDDQSEDASKNLLCALGTLIELMPTIKVHFILGNSVCKDENPHLIKFGWQQICVILDENSFSTISEALLIVTACVCLRGKTQTIRENSEKALNYLNLVQKNNLDFPFVYYYMQAFVNYNIGNLDVSLYNLQHRCTSNSNLFMQARSYTLKGQVLLMKDEPDAALLALQSVQYKHREFCIPLCAFLTGEAFGKLGKVKQKTEILDLLLECLSAEPAVQPKMISPLVGMEHRLLLSMHDQPEVRFEEVLQSCAKAYLPVQPKKAAAKFLQLLHATNVDENYDVDDGLSKWKLSELLHDTTCALLEANSVYDAQIICEAALQFHLSRFDMGKSAKHDLSSLKEDVVALMLLAEIKDLQQSSDVSDILNRCASLLQNLLEKVTKLGDGFKETIFVSKSLLARVFLNKALLNSRRHFEDDAVACFQRALHWKEDDTEVILQFAYYLLETNQLEESMALWRMYEDNEKSFKETNNITLNHLLGFRMNRDQKEETICRLKSLQSCC